MILTEFTFESLVRSIVSILYNKLGHRRAESKHEYREI